MAVVVAVFLGGGLGAVTRLGVGVWARRVWPGPMPWGTLIVNVAGCFALGMLATLFADRLAVSPPVKAGLTTGFLGGLTTFSTFGVETVQLLGGEGAALGVINLLGNVVIGLAAALAGVWLASR